MATCGMQSTEVSEADCEKPEEARPYEASCAACAKSAPLVAASAGSVWPLGCSLACAAHGSSVWLASRPASCGHGWLAVMQYISVYDWLMTTTTVQYSLTVSFYYVAREMTSYSDYILFKWLFS